MPNAVEEIMQNQTSPIQEINPTPTTPVEPTNHVTVGASLAIALLFPLSIGAAIAGVRRYQKNRLRRQIAKLERIWNLTHRR